MVVKTANITFILMKKKKKKTKKKKAAEEEGEEEEKEDEEDEEERKNSEIIQRLPMNSTLWRMFSRYLLTEYEMSPASKRAQTYHLHFFSPFIQLFALILQKIIPSEGYSLKEWFCIFTIWYELHQIRIDLMTCSTTIDSD